MKWLRRLSWLIKLALVVAVVTVFMRYPGVIQLEWLGYRIQTSVALFFLALLFVLLSVGAVVALLKAIWHFPRYWFEHHAKCQREKAERALLEGIVAIAAHEFDEAERLAQSAIHALPNQPLNKILAAQAAFLQGKTDASRRLSQELQQHKATRFLGLRGEALQAMQQGEWAIAQRALRQAAALRPDSPWALKHLFEMDLRLEAYDRSEGVLKQLQTRDLVPKPQVVRYQALTAWLRAQSGANFYHEIKKAHELAPDIVSIAVALGNYELKAGHTSRAQKILSQTWQHQPHPALVPLLRRTLPTSASALDFYRYLEGISKELEAHVLLAEAALEAKLWGQARQHLQTALQRQETQQACLLMADLCRQEEHDESKALQWIQKAFAASPNPSWICEKCHATALAWEVFCQNCKSFDSILWQTSTQGCRKYTHSPGLL